MQPGSIWVPYGLAHVNRIMSIIEAGADPGFLLYKGGFDLKIIPDNLIVYADFFWEIPHENG